jgi:hypothetical protein
VETKETQYMRGQNLTKYQVDLVIGSLIGDEYLVKTTSGYAFRVNHGLAQKKYVDWKYHILRNFVRTAPKKSGRCYYFRTITHPTFQHIRGCFYEGKIKRVPTNLIENRFNPFILAVWIMDDGAKDGNQLRINSQSFTREDNQLLQEILRTKLGIVTTLNKDKNRYRLRVKAESMTKLSRLVRKHFIPSMFYKLPL